MSRLATENRGYAAPPPHPGWQRSAVAERESSLGPPSGLVLAGLVTVGLGVLAWYYLGPDLKRYLKIRNM